MARYDVQLNTHMNQPELDSGHTCPPQTSTYPMPSLLIFVKLFTFCSLFFLNTSLTESCKLLACMDQRDRLNKDKTYSIMAFILVENILDVHVHILLRFIDHMVF